MIVYDLTGGEDNQHYQHLQVDNLTRQYDFLRSIISTAVRLDHQGQGCRNERQCGVHAARPWSGRTPYA